MERHVLISLRIATKDDFFEANDTRKINIPYFYKNSLGVIETKVYYFNENTDIDTFRSCYAHSQIYVFNDVTQVRASVNCIDWDLVETELEYELNQLQQIKKESLDMKGKVFSEAIEHLNKNKWTGVPNQAIPYCSDYLKTRVSHHFAKNIFQTTNYIKAIGYRKEDMPKRITLAELKEDKNRIAPNITDFETPIGQNELNLFFEQEPFKLHLHSSLGNCELCWKKSDKTLIESIQYGTRFIDWHRDEETKYGNRFFRENKSIDDLVALAESGIQLNLLNEFNGDRCVCNF
ncbi:phosphoadenosine phosphosulfate reductase [Flavobacterium sp. J27]|uniref:phosphoadenosine phosphosulfate reductase n=1 Tax=Flavobacterium sp. J27 TaxID=2060419 RepID=UPI00103127CD|nr:phosphoadenosine phosphosulfate reductase [Flavobacterium sp. J27]